MAGTTTPRVFLSYAWTDADYQERIVEIGTRLRGDGIDVVLDVWDLGPGQDKFHFMESMVGDPTLGFVLVLCNAKYAEKANAREGGVGDETLIITPQVYTNAKNTKFIPVIMERNAAGKAFVPLYLQSRIYIDLASDQFYHEQYDKLLRILHGAPEFPKPELGRKPAFLEPGAVTGSTTLPRLRRALAALEQGKPFAVIAATEHLDAIAESVLALRAAGGDGPMDDQLIDAIQGSKHLRDETLELLPALVAAVPAGTSAQLLADFLQRLLAGCYPHSGATADTLEAVRFATTELFLYIVAQLLNGDRLDVLGAFITERFIFEEMGNRKVEGFDAFFFPFEWIETRRKGRLQSRRTSLVADLIHERADRAKIPFPRLQEADFLLYLRSKFTDEHGYWWPRTLIYLNPNNQAFDIFVAQGSRRYEARLRTMLGTSDRGELQAKLDALDPHSRKLRFTDAHMPLSVPRLMNLEHSK